MVAGDEYHIRPDTHQRRKDPVHLLDHGHLAVEVPVLAGPVGRLEVEPRLFPSLKKKFTSPSCSR